MGTVVEKIEYIKGTKSAIRAAIVQKGVAVGEDVTFRQYADKIAEIDGSGVSAAYVFENSETMQAFPQLPSTESREYIFTDAAAYQASQLSFSVYELTDTETIAAYFDRNQATNGNMINGLFFKFDRPVKLSRFYAYCGDQSSSYSLTLRGSNNPAIQTDRSSELWSEIYSGAYQPADFITVNPDQAYQYYLLTKDSGYLTVYELLFYAVVGAVRCTLASPNMTPTVSAYADDYMRLLTQPYFDGGQIVEAQTLIMKPYAEGGNLINYTDDGRAVELQMYLLTGTEPPLYLLSPDNSFVLPEGYDRAVAVADLSLPAHVYKNADGTWVMGNDGELPPPITPDR